MGGWKKPTGEEGHPNKTSSGSIMPMVEQEVRERRRVRKLVERARDGLLLDEVSIEQDEEGKQKTGTSMREVIFQRSRGKTMNRQRREGMVSIYGIPEGAVEKS